MAKTKEVLLYDASLSYIIGVVNNEVYAQGIDLDIYTPEFKKLNRNAQVLHIQEKLQIRLNQLRDLILTLNKLAGATVQASAFLDVALDWKYLNRMEELMLKDIRCYYYLNLFLRKLTDDSITISNTEFNYFLETFIEINTNLEYALYWFKKDTVSESLVEAKNATQYFIPEDRDECIKIYEHLEIIYNKIT